MMNKAAPFISKASTILALYYKFLLSLLQPGVWYTPDKKNVILNSFFYLFSLKFWA